MSKAQQDFTQSAIEDVEAAMGEVALTWEAKEVIESLVATTFIRDAFFKRKISQLEDIIQKLEGQDLEDSYARKRQ